MARKVAGPTAVAHFEVPVLNPLDTRCCSQIRSCGTFGRARILGVSPNRLGPFGAPRPSRQDGHPDQGAEDLGLPPSNIRRSAPRTHLMARQRSASSAAGAKVLGIKRVSHCCPRENKAPRYSRSAPPIGCFRLGKEGQHSRNMRITS